LLDDWWYSDDLFVVVVEIEETLVPGEWVSPDATDFVVIT